MKFDIYNPFMIKFLVSFLISNAQILEYPDDYEMSSIESDQNDISQSIINDSNSFKKYGKLIINDVAINLNDEDENNQSSGMQIYKAYYKDDLYFECDIPPDLLIGKYKWSVNGHVLINGSTDFDEPVFTLVLNEKIDTNTSFLNVSCFFDMEYQTFSIQFPLIHLGDYYYFNKYILTSN
jgi:hypothetical protein